MANCNRMSETNMDKIAKLKTQQKNLHKYKYKKHIGQNHKFYRIGEKIKEQYYQQNILGQENNEQKIQKNLYYQQKM